MGPFMKGLSFIFKDFSCWTSSHGVPHIGMAKSHILRLIWSVIVIGCIIAFFFQLLSIIRKYYAYEVNTEAKLEFTVRQFPAVMICSLNPWKNTDLYSSPFMNDMVTSYINSNPDPQFGFDKGRTGERQQQGVKMTSLANQHLFGLIDVPDKADPHYTYSDLVIACSYYTMKCNETDWTPKKDPNFGMCYVYNLDESHLSFRSGPLYGLRLIVRTNQNLYLPWTESAGVAIAVYDKRDEPYPDVLGYYAPPGTASALGVRYVKTSRKGAPYGTCREDTECEFAHFKGKYQIESCYRSCMQTQIIKKCGCYDPTYPFIGSGTSCFGDGFDSSTWDASAKNLACIEELYDSEATTFNLFKDCAECMPPCEMNTYMVTVSTAQWPSNEHKPGECTAYNQTGQPWLGDFEIANETNCLIWYQSHTLLAEIFYERMNYQVVAESAAYTIVNVISDIGGQLGLFLGMSIISILEFFILIFILFYFCTTHNSRRIEMDDLQKSVEKTKQEYAKDDFDTKPRRKGMSNIYNPMNLRDADRSPVPQ